MSNAGEKKGKSQKRKKRDIPAALGVCPPSPGLDDFDVPGLVTESIQQSSQSSMCDGEMTTNTTLSIERKTLGSLFAGATLSNCVLNINVYK